MIQALDRQLNVIWALTLRETRTRFGQYQLGYLWAFVEPIVWILSFYLIFALVDRPSPRGMSLFGFLATGMITYELFAKTAEKVSLAINVNRPLLFYPQVRPLDLTYARWFLETSTHCSVFVVIMGAELMVTGQTLRISDPLSLLLGLLLASALGYGVGLIFCMAQVIFPSLEKVRGPLMRPLFWTSGIFFTANSLPLEARNILMYNPVMHAVEFVRQGWFTSYEAKWASYNYLFGWVLALLFIGTLLEREIRRRIEVT